MDLHQEKIKAAKKLREEYTDVYGRQTLYPAVNSDPENHRFDSENQNLFSGQAIMLLNLNNLMNWTDIENFHRGLNTCKIMPGLYSRYPLSYNEPTRHGISHDEMTGISIGCMAIGETEIPQQMIDYGKRHNWTFIDENPSANLFSSFANFKKYIGRVRQPKDRALYKIAAGHEVSLFGALNILVGSYLSSKKPIGKKRDEHTSGRIMWYYKFQAMKLVQCDSKIIDFARKQFQKNNTEIYGSEDYMDEVIAVYFKEGHPFRTLIKGLRLE